jgi:hypothetical protein
MELKERRKEVRKEEKLGWYFRYQKKDMNKEETEK